MEWTQCIFQLNQLLTRVRQILRHKLTTPADYNSYRMTAGMCYDGSLLRPHFDSIQGFKKKGCFDNKDAFLFWQLLNLNIQKK